jgi:hypothetical protein
MNRDPHQSDDSFENDAVWKLLDQAPPEIAGPRFVDDTVRAARLSGQPEPWWKRFFAPLPLTGLAAASAALVFAVLPMTHSDSEPDGSTVAVLESQRAAEIQEIAETEALIAAVDHLDAFSNNELASLIGF